MISGDSNIEFKIINPITYPGWNKLLLEHLDYSFFHTSFWAEVLYESYNFKPLYFIMIRDNKLLAALPVMEVKSIFSGKRGVSLPFSDYCAPLLRANLDLKNYYNSLIEHAKQRGWKYLEIRGDSKLTENAAHYSYYYHHDLNLSGNERAIFDKFRSSTRRNIRKAVNEGVKVDLCNSLDSINEFYRLHCITRKSHGIPPQPYYFFKKIFDHNISKNHGFVALAYYKGKIIAGAITFHYGLKAIYKYGASDINYLRMRPNNIVMWEAIRWYINNGYTNFSFGRTELGNIGLRKYKMGWGTEESVLKYYRYSIKKETYLVGGSTEVGISNKILSKTPLFLLKLIGLLLYKRSG